MTMVDYPKDLGNNRWIIEVKGREGSDELYIEIPPKALNQMGWDEGDVIAWIKQNDGTWMLQKQDKE